MKLIEPVLNWIHAKRWKLTSDENTRINEKNYIDAVHKHTRTHLGPKNRSPFVGLFSCTGISLHLPSHSQNPPEFIEFFPLHYFQPKRCTISVYFICKLVLWFTMPPIKQRVMHDCFFDSFHLKRHFNRDHIFPFISSSYDDFHQWYANFFRLSSLNTLTFIPWHCFYSTI